MPFVTAPLQKLRLGYGGPRLAPAFQAEPDRQGKDGALNGHTPQLQRRSLFAVLLAIIVLPLVVLALVPDHQVSAQETELIASGGDIAQTSATSAPSTTAAPSTTVAPRSRVPATVATTRAPTTTAAPTPSTTAKPYVPATTPPTTTAAAPAPAPAPAPVYVPPPAPSASGSDAAFLACVKRRESGGNYGAVSPGGTYRGAYQFYQGSWDNTARHAGRPDLVGVPPNQASPADQDAMALALLQWVGRSPWGGYCA